METWQATRRLEQLVIFLKVLDALSPQQLICAGMVTPALTQAAANRSLTLTDYFAREELAVANAVPAALAIWLHNRAAGGASPAAPVSPSSR